MKKVSFQLSEELHSELQDAASEQDKSMASVCREALSEQLGRMNEEPDLPPELEIRESLSNQDSQLERLENNTQELRDNFESRPNTEKPRARSHRPWYERYSEKINNFYSAPAPKKKPKKTRKLDRSQYDDWWNHHLNNALRNANQRLNPPSGQRLQSTPPSPTEKCS